MFAILQADMKQATNAHNDKKRKHVEEHQLVCENAKRQLRDICAEVVGDSPALGVDDATAQKIIDVAQTVMTQSQVLKDIESTKFTSPAAAAFCESEPIILGLNNLITNDVWFDEWIAKHPDFKSNM